MYAITRITAKLAAAVARALLAARLPVRAVVRAAGKGVTWPNAAARSRSPI